MDIKKVDKSPVKIEKKEHMKIPKTGVDTVATDDGHFSFAQKVMKQEGTNIVRDSTKAVSSSIAKKTTTEFDGGEEINQATSIVATGAAPAYKTASFAGKQLKKKTYVKSKIKKVQPGKKVTKSSVKKVGKYATKTAAKEITKTAVKAGVTIGVNVNKKQNAAYSYNSRSSGDIERVKINQFAIFDENIFIISSF